MAHLYQALTWTIDEPELSREYVILGNGELLANVTRVAITHPESAAMPYTNPHARHDETRMVVCAKGPDGTPYFYVDRTNNPMSPEPAFVVAPNGDLIGSVATRTSGIKGVFKLLAGQTEGGYALLDPHGRNLAIMANPPWRDPRQDGCVTDAAGEELARYTIDRSPYVDRRRRYTMRLRRVTPEPLRTLLFASLIAVELMNPTP